MASRRRCPFCRRLFIPDARVKELQQTCGRQECRRARKRQSNEHWRSKHPDYFRGMYQQQKEAYGTRAEYKKRYRKETPEYVRRNAAFVKKSKARRQRGGSERVSHTSRNLFVTISGQKTNLTITQVSHTSRDLLVTVSQSDT